MRDFDESVKLAPALDGVWTTYAFFRATCPDAGFRDGKKAIEMAKKAIDLAGKDAGWEHSAALAAAYAELGQFDDAIVEQTAVLADKSLDKVDRAAQEQRLDLFKKMQPYRDVE